jgi:methyl-accepting chemotaxis protein
MKFTTRIWVIVLTSMLGLLIMGSLGLHSMRESMLEDRKKEITQLLNFADAQLKYFQQQEKMGFLSRAEAQAKAKEAIGSMRHEHDYFFIRSLSDDVMLVHPIASRVGQVDYGGKMKDGRYLVQMYKDELEKSSDGKAFVWGAAPRPDKKGDATLYPKLSGIKKFEPWDWLTGIGFFVDDINDFFWSQATIFVVVGAVLLAALGWLVIGMRNAILSQLGGEPEVASESMRRIANGDLAVDIPLHENDNESLMAALKLMQLKLNNISSAIQENADSLNDQVRSFDLMAKNYQQTKSEEQFNYLLAAVKKIGRTVDILGKSTARIKL